VRICPVFDVGHYPPVLVLIPYLITRENPRTHEVLGTPLPCSEWESRPFPEEPEVASILPTAQDCTIAVYCTTSLWSQLTACHAPGLADLNQCDLNHWFQSRFKSIDFLSKKIEWFKSHWRFRLPMKNYNKQDEMYCFIVLFCPLFNLFNSSTTDFSL